MTTIRHSNIGTISIDNTVLSTMIADRLLAHSGSLLPCNKKGKLYRKRRSIKGEDILGSIELKANKNEYEIKFYVIGQSVHNLETSIDRLFDDIEFDFALMHLDKPACMTACVKGLVDDEQDDYSQEVVRING